MAILRGSGRSRVWISRKATCKLHRAHADTQIVRRVRMQGGTAQRNVHSMIVESVDPAEFGSSVVPCAGGLPLLANLEPRPGVRGAGWLDDENITTMQQLSAGLRAQSNTRAAAKR